MTRNFSTLRHSAGIPLLKLAEELSLEPALVTSWEEGAVKAPDHVMRSLDIMARYEGRVPPSEVELSKPSPAPPPTGGERDEKRPTLISLFAGAGGLDVGLERAGFDTLFANEIEPYACESLRANRVLRSLDARSFEAWFCERILHQRCYAKISPIEKMSLKRRLSSALAEDTAYLEHACISELDVRKLAASSILEATHRARGEVDLIAGGPPCQPFSRAGKRELVDCDTGQLFREFVRLVDQVRPRFFLFENVKGLVLHKADVAALDCQHCGRSALVDFDLRDSLKDQTNFESTCPHCGMMGICGVTWEKRRAGSLDIIVHEFERLGYQCHSTILNAADFGAPQLRERLFIVGSRDGERFSWPKPTHSERAGGGRPNGWLFEDAFDLKPRRTMNEALFKAGHWHYGQLDSNRAVLWVKNVVRPHDEPVTWTLDRAAPTIGAHQAAKLAIAPLGVPAEQLHRQQWHVLGRRQGDTPPVFVEHEYLTDKELLELQTFPSSWYLHGTRMQRAFQIGNAVPPVLAEAVGNALMATMGLNADTALEKRSYAIRHAVGL